MDEAFSHLTWYVAGAYEWLDWLGKDGKPLEVVDDELLGLELEGGVELAWQHHHERDEKPGPVLCPVLDSGTARSYHPMDRKHASLFLRFAEIDYRDRNAIREFASAYGLLGQDTQQQGPFSRAGGTHWVDGESHLTWAREICLMKEVLRLGRLRTAQEIANERKAYAKHKLKPPDGARLEKLAWLFNYHLQQVQGRMLFEPDLSPRLVLTPVSLLAAMWLQLALTISGDKQFRACKFCRRLFEISTEPTTGYRRHREFCSDSCKTKDYRRRKRGALILAHKGTAAATIAKRLDMNVVTVRTWLAEAKARGREKGKK